MFSVKRRFVSTTVFVVSTLLLASASPVTVEDGVYSRVTVQIEAQPQPENCVEFLNQLEVRMYFVFPPSRMTTTSTTATETTLTRR